MHLQRPSLSNRITAEFRHHDALAKILPVLDPIEMHAQAGKLLLFELSFFEQSVECLNHFLRGARGGVSLQMVQLQNHVSQAARRRRPCSPRERLRYTAATCFAKTAFTAATIFSSFGRT